MTSRSAPLRNIFNRVVHITEHIEATVALDDPQKLASATHGGILEIYNSLNSVVLL